MKFLFQIKTIINDNSTLQFLFDRSKSLVLFVPFYLTKEGLDNQTGAEVKPKIKIDDWGLVYLGASDMKQVSETPGVKETEQDLLKRLEAGCLCLGLKNGSTIVAHMWCNLSMCDSPLLGFPLKQNEAYLTGARTLEAYKGKNIAPYLRYHFYKLLHEMGRTELYSVTEYFNKSAIKFKEKLGARQAGFYVHLCFLKRHRTVILLRRY